MECCYARQGCPLSLSKLSKGENFYVSKNGRGRIIVRWVPFLTLIFLIFGMHLLSPFFETFYVTFFAILTSLLFYLQIRGEGSKWGRILPGIHWAYQIFSSPLIGQNSQWEAENPSFLVIWPTDKCEGSSMSFVSKNVFYIYTMGFVYINII